MPEFLTTVVLDPRQEHFLRWLMDPRSEAKPESEGQLRYKGSQADYAKRRRVAVSTLEAWKRDPRFRAAWDELIQTVAGGPERLALFLQELADIAAGADKNARTADRIAAMKLHMEVTGRHAPKQVIEIRDPKLEAATNDDLLARAEGHAKRIAQARQVIEGRVLAAVPDDG
jgi:hypothetical protein